MDENQHDKKQFIELYEMYYAKIYNYILRNITHRETAEDLTSNTFLKALKYITGNKTGKIENYKAWLYKIATNELLMHHRYNRKRVVINYDTEDFQSYLALNNNILEIGEKTFDTFAIKQAIDKMKSFDKIIIEMHFFENIGYQDMAVILNLKENTLRSHIHRALKKLKILLDIGDYQ
jgi:RNA polymerase sigma-70 factor, ECF subfamily